MFEGEGIPNFLQMASVRPTQLESSRLRQQYLVADDSEAFILSRISEVEKSKKSAPLRDSNF
jgi:hypothetical protein